MAICLMIVLIHANASHCYVHLLFRTASQSLKVTLIHLWFRNYARQLFKKKKIVVKKSFQQLLDLLFDQDNKCSNLLVGSQFMQMLFILIISPSSSALFVSVALSGPEQVVF